MCCGIGATLRYRSCTAVIPENIYACCNHSTSLLSCSSSTAVPAFILEMYDTNYRLVRTSSEAQQKPVIYDSAAAATCKRVPYRNINASGNIPVQQGVSQFIWWNEGTTAIWRRRRWLLLLLLLLEV